MPTIQVGPGSDLELQLIADAMGKSKKVVVVTGAGISTNCGIPDFRSENGLYSLIQAQYDAALKNPPWEESNTFDIDDRPKKKQRKWYFEVVAPDGKVVDVIDEETGPIIGPGKEEKRCSTRSGSTTHTNSSKPIASSDETSSNSQLLDLNANLPISQSRSPLPFASVDELPDDSLSLATTSEPLQRKNLQTATEEPGHSSRSSRITPTTSELTDFRLTEPYSVITEAIHEKDPHSTGQPDRYCRSSRSAITALVLPTSETDTQFTQEALRRSSRSRSTNTTNSRSSTPKSTESSLTSVSSRTPELPIFFPTNSSELYLDSQNAQSTTTEDPPIEDPLTQASSFGLSRTASDTTSRTLPNLKGRDLFDSRIWASPFETSIFYMFISSLREKIQKITTTTETHKFIKTLRDGGRLVRNYTQNIDCLEEREGLCQDLAKGAGSKTRFHPKTRQEARESGINGFDHLNGCEVVPLHGTLAGLRCDICREPTNWDQPAILNATLSGTAPDCSNCTEAHSRRTSKGRRGLAIGRLRPDIVLYGEDHPHSNLISPIVTHDLSVGADVLLIMGTSLRVHGLKVMVREFAKAVHTKGGKVIFVNQTKPSESTWGEFIDFWVEMDCDEWVLDLRDRREDIWTSGLEENNKESGPEPRKRPQCLRDDKINGVFLTYKILDIIGKALDGNGKVAARHPYWLSRPSRVSDVPVPKPKRPPKKPNRKKAKNSVLAKKPATTKPKNNQRKAETEEDRKNVAYIVAKKWEEIRKIAPSLPAPPPELTLPFKNLPTKPFSWATPFVFSNHLPNVGGSSWPLDKMNLVTHPPCGADIPIHTPKAKAVEKPVVERLPIKHSYGTRARRRLSTAETIVVDNGDITMEADNTIVVADDPMTPASRRIKRSCSIGALVSSSPEQWHDAPETMT